MEMVLVIIKKALMQMIVLTFQEIQYLIDKDALTLTRMVIQIQIIFGIQEMVQMHSHKIHFSGQILMAMD